MLERYEVQNSTVYPDLQCKSTKDKFSKLSHHLKHGKRAHPILGVGWFDP
jgi:hypothetical protein